MRGDIAVLTVSLLTLLINFYSNYIMLPRRFNLPVSIAAPVLFTAVLHFALFVSGNTDNLFGGWRGIVYLPLVLILLRGEFFQKIFSFFFAIVFTGTQMAVAEAAAEYFTRVGSDEYYLTWFVITAVMFAAYVTLMGLFGRRVFPKLFVDGRRAEWALYSFGAVFSFACITVLSYAFTGPERIVLLLFVLWSFISLCFAVINANEKAKQQYDAEFAANVISSGRGHYAKMTELHDTLSILRHDYKYHITAMTELAGAGNTEELSDYLRVLREQTPEDGLRVYCKNTVINALLSHYAERCAKLGIEYGVSAALPERFSIPNYELCIIFGNLLENAVEACEKLTGGGKIELVVRTQHKMFTVMVKNSYDGVVKEENGQPVSAKKDGGETVSRGFGLRSVRAVSDRYDGHMLTEWDEGTFTVYVMLNV